MIPIILYSPQACYTAGVMSEQPMEEHRLFVGEVGSMMNGKDMRLAAPIAYRFLAKRLSSTLQTALGQDLAEQAVAIPLVDKSHDPTQFDTLRGILVIAPSADTCETGQLRAAAQGVVRRWACVNNQTCHDLTHDPDLGATNQVLIKHCQSLQPGYGKRALTWSESTQITPELEQALRPIEAKLQADGLSQTTPTTVNEQASRPMIPLIIHASQEYSVPGVMGETPMRANHLWVVDLNAYAGRDARNATPAQRELIYTQLGETLQQILGADAGKNIQVMPLFEPTTPLDPDQPDDRPDHLRGMIVRLSNPASCWQSELGDLPTVFAHDWQQKTGEECVAVSMLSQYSVESQHMAEAIKRNVPGAKGGFDVSDGIEVNEAFDTMLRSVQSCVKSSELTRNTALAATSPKSPRRI